MKKKKKVNRPSTNSGTEQNDVFWSEGKLQWFTTPK